MHVGGHARVDGVRLEVGVEEAFTVAVERFIVAFKQKRVCDFVPNFANSRFHDTSVDKCLERGLDPGLRSQQESRSKQGSGHNAGTNISPQSEQSESEQSNEDMRKVVRAFLYKKVFLFWFYFSKAG